MSLLFCFLTAILSATSSSYSVFTRERFEEFKEEVLDLVTCGRDTACDAGLTADNPLVTPYDLNSGNSATQNLIHAIVRLAFHDCGATDPKKISKGKTKDFTKSKKNGKAGGCNGCIGINNPKNDPLLDAIIEPLEPICSGYADVISRADCWMLAATISIEEASRNVDRLQGPPFFVQIDDTVKEGDIPYYYGRSDCDNGYYDGANVRFPFSNPEGVFFEFPDPTLGWTHMAEFFKSRLGWNNGKHSSSSSEESGDTEYFTNTDIVALIAGAHSLGRAHELVTGFSGSWDFTPDILENSFVSLLFAEEWAQNNQPPGFAIKQNYIQEKRNPNNPIAMAQWQIPQPPGAIARFRLDQPPTDNPPNDALEMSFNTDFSMVFDISYFIENGLSEQIDCVSNAALVCPENQTILTAPRGETSNFNVGKNGHVLGEQYECGVNEVCCEYKQCPIQCEGGIKEYRRLVDNNLIDTLPDTSDCPAGIAQKYSQRNKQDTTQTNRALGQDFAKAFIKMITIGYVDPKTGQTLLNTVPPAVADIPPSLTSTWTINLTLSSIEFIGGLMGILILCNICLMCNIYVKNSKKGKGYVSVKVVDSECYDTEENNALKE